jgi:hypothetical protein
MDRPQPVPSRRSRCAAYAFAAAWLAIGATAPSAATTEGAADDLPTLWAAAAAAPPQAADPASQLPTEPAPPATPTKNYVLPAVEIAGFSFLLNQYNRHFADDADDYKSNLSTIRHNLRSSWVVDSDPFRTNQLGHPYLGSMYHGFARSAGLNYWEALGYTFAGSALWEIAGERTPPSRNDLINTGVGGTFLGEALFRMAHVVLAHDEIPPLWRELGAALISPATGFNRLAFGNRFDGLFDSHDPVHYSKLQVGFSGTAQNDAGQSATNLKRNELLVDFAMDYGIPGKPGYRYDRPFDYFNFQTTVSSANGAENLMTRGLLVGKDYALGPDYRGIYGLYGSYDYIAPQTFRVSSTALSFGTGRTVVGVERHSAAGHGAARSRLCRRRHDAQHGRQRLSLRPRPAGAAVTAPDLRRPGFPRPDRPGVFRHPRRGRRSRRPRQHRARRCVIDLARLSPARDLAQVPGQSPRRFLPRFWRQQSNPVDAGHLLHLARPGPFRRRRVALIRP